LYNHITGSLYEKKVDSLVVENNGIGYQVNISQMTYNELPEVGKEVFLFLHQVVRENEFLFYGFNTVEERSLFLNILRVSGVGPSVAIQILNQAPIQNIVQSVISGDIDFLTKLKGIGKKTAERIVIELRDKLSSVEETQKSKVITGTEPYPKDAFLALLTLGFSPEAARERLGKLSESDSAPEKTDDWIRLALKNG
jgi:holliday junction DNA helicase RuvA